MKAERICTFLLSATFLLQILPPTYAWTCPAPGADDAEMNIIVTKKYNPYFGELYMFEDSLNDIATGWNLVTGSGNDEVSYFRAYRSRIGKQFSGGGIEGVTKHLRCGGFEKRIRVCRGSQSLSAQTSLVYYDFLSEESCEDREATEKFSFYVSGERRNYESTTRFKAAICQNVIMNTGGERRSVSGVVGYGDPDCDSTQDQFTFHAFRRNKMCYRINAAPPSASLVGSNTEDDIWQESVTFRCYRGYITSSGGTEQSITCFNGDWSTSPEACHKIRCGDLPQIVNGAWSSDNNEYQSHATLECYEGYEIPDNYYSRIQCQEDGTWTQSSSTCQPKNCRYPGTPQHGEIHGDSYTYGAQVTFSCDEGYWMEGGNNISCQANGRWDGGPPSCNRKVCGGILAPQNGLKVGYDFGTGSSVSFACHDGYDLVGETRITCYEIEGEIAGEWDYEVPTCEEVICVVPTSPENGVVSGNDFSYGATITYRCHPGYIRTGVQSSRCGENGQWNSPAPTCSALVCQDLTAPENGVMDGESFSFGSRVVFSCEEGFTIVGTSTLTCKEDGRWSDNTPRCQAVACPELPNIDNGVRIGAASNEYGIEVHWQCFPGYQLVGDETTGCRSDRTWTNPVPACHVCPRDWYKEGANAEECQQCPEHSTTLTDASPSIDHCNCQQGYTKLDDNSCLPVRCAPLSPPQNGSIADDCSTDFGGECTFNCDPGFVLSSGSRTVTCRADGWSASAPICNECPLNTYKETVGSLTCHPCPRNSHTFGRAGTSQDSCVCLPGYEHPEDSNDCDDVDECQIDNGGCNHECIDTQGSYYCGCTIAGYELEVDGRTCVAVRSCPELDTRMIHGELDCRYTETENGHICFIKCSEGFFFVSGQNDYITCGVETNWVWSHRLVNSSAVVPACTEEFFVDTKITMDYSYSLGAGGCNNVPAYEEQLKAVISAGVETVAPCNGRCWVSDIRLNCTELEDGTSALFVSFDLYLINVEQNAVGPNCDMSCRSANLRQMYGDTFAVVQAVGGIVLSSGATLTLNENDAPAIVTTSFSYQNPNILCKKQGHVLTKYRLCVPCAPGTYLPNPEYETCESCPVGTYQRLEGQTGCTNCPEDSTTLTDGSDHPTQCSERISIIGLNPAGLTLQRRRRSTDRLADEKIDIDEVLSFL